jgi:hypothetical protein
MNEHDNTITTPKPRRGRRAHEHHTTFLPKLVSRVHAAEFSTQQDIARAYGTVEGTVTYWKKRALDMGLTDSRAWNRGLLLGRVLTQ